MTAAVAPGSIEEAAFVVREAAARGAHVMPVGGGTKLWWRGDPLDPGGRETVRLETGGLNRVVELSPGDMTVTVEAGMTLAALDALLEPHRLWWPVDADTHDGKATIGGVLASDSGGPMRMSLGGPREHVLGVSIVIGDGALVSAGGRVVKNVAGYDLHRLMVGSWGALGLIAAASLKLRPRPECVRSVVINAATLPEAIRTCDELLDGPLSPVGVTLRWPGMHVSSASSAEGGWRFAVAACFAGDEGFAAAQVEASRRALGGAVEMTPFGDACQPLSAEWRDPRTDRTRVEAWVSRSMLALMLMAANEESILRSFCVHPCIGAIGASCRDEAEAVRLGGIVLEHGGWFRSSGPAGVRWRRRASKVVADLEQRVKCAMDAVGTFPGLMFQA